MSDGSGVGLDSSLYDHFHARDVRVIKIEFENVLGHRLSCQGKYVCGEVGRSVVRGNRVRTCARNEFSSHQLVGTVFIETNPFLPIRLTAGRKGEVVWIGWLRGGEGEEDDVLPVEDAYKYEEHLPRCERVELVPSAQHAPALENPTYVADAIIRFSKEPLAA